jgi:putative glutamine amidotransferase
MQLLNVLQGGTLYQDLADQYQSSLNHCRRDLPRTSLTHDVLLEEDSLIARIVGCQKLSINSLHHQAVKEPGRGIRISGRASDGIPEVLEMPDHRFVVAVQGHPEEIYGSVPAFSKLFEAFVAACANLPEAVPAPLAEAPVRVVPVAR